ncbi:MAG: M13 family metallopeptidase, partial [Gemmatimonadetes bacterium]|nr:M13 family metallopeptidase [Gemmatimonadota bacterium]
EIPADMSVYGSFTELFLRSEEQVQAIIEEVAAQGAPEGTVSQKVGDLYASYLDTAALDRKGLEPLEREFERIRRANSPQAIATLLARYKRAGGTTPFNFYMDQDAKDPSTYRVHFFQSGLGLPDRDYYLDEENPRFASARELYREYLVTMLRLAGTQDPEGRAAAIYDLEAALAESHWPSEEARDVDRTYNKMSPKELAEAAPGFPWAAYLEKLNVRDTDAYIVAMPSAYAGMAKTFGETPLEVWKDWMVYRLLRNNASVLSTEIDDAHFAFTSAALSGAQEKRAREKRAIQFVNAAMGQAVGRLYVERHFTQDAKDGMDELVQNLIVAMGDRIDGLEWMSAETRKKAREKLSKFVVKIGYPDEWRDYTELEVVPGDLLKNAWRAAAFEHDREVGKLGKPVDRHEWFMNPQTVNAYYNPGMNEIVFPAAILQPPFFDPYADDAINYGGIGAVIGHEIGHGFDDQGRKYDGDGVLQDWWTEEDAARFKERADMLVEQYNGFSPLEGMYVNGELTLGENIGDVGGLEIAYHAYRLSLDGKEPPVLGGLTGDQRFFLGFAQIWRGKLRDQLMVQMIASNPHSPLEFRVNGSVRNVDAWYAAFDVQPDDSMYLEPDHRVRIW